MTTTFDRAVGHSSHTAGPWKVLGGNIVTSPDFGWKGAVVATACHRDLGTNTYDVLRAEANARLISAAPEMLAALEAVVADLGDDYTGTTWDAIRAAIAKARGEG